MLGKKRFLVICQILLIWFLGLEAYGFDQVTIYAVPPSDLRIALCRFLCAVFMHITLSDELR